MKKRKWLLLVLGLILFLPLVAIAAWIVTETAIQATSSSEFCSSCHTMQPFVETYALDTHGGRNPRGLAADCVDCHLPHESPARYLAAKVATGIHDGWAELAALFREPDWIAGLDQRGEYVYDSGCLLCHARLQEAADQQPTAVFAHQTYFNGDGRLQCVTCHAHVGHKDLRTRLSTGAGESATAVPHPGSTQEDQP